MNDAERVSIMDSISWMYYVRASACLFENHEKMQSRGVQSAEPTITFTNINMAMSPSSSIRRSLNDI